MPRKKDATSPTSSNDDSSAAEKHEPEESDVQRMYRNMFLQDRGPNKRRIKPRKLEELISDTSAVVAAAAAASTDHSDEGDNDDDISDDENDEASSSEKVSDAETGSDTSAPKKRRLRSRTTTAATTTIQQADEDSSDDPEDEDFIGSSSQHDSDDDGSTSGDGGEEDSSGASEDSDAMAEYKTEPSSTSLNSPSTSRNKKRRPSTDVVPAMDLNFDTLWREWVRPGGGGIRRPLTPSQKEKQPDYCCVCLEDCVMPDDALVFCESVDCDVCVHQSISFYHDMSSLISDVLPRVLWNPETPAHGRTVVL